jgi:hypothetical protein
MAAATRREQASAVHCVDAPRTASLLVDFRMAPATGTAERETALVMVDDVLVGQRRITLAADRALRHPGLREGLPRAQRRAPRRAEQIGEA